MNIRSRQKTELMEFYIWDLNYSVDASRSFGFLKIRLILIEGKIILCFFSFFKI